MKGSMSATASRVGVIALLSLLVGCSSLNAVKDASSPPPTAEVFNRSMAEADALAVGKDRDGAIRAYQKIAGDFPGRAEPWVKVAQNYFDQSLYAMALVSAEEALKRDPLNSQAKSITAVGGLRLAIRSLEELRRDEALKGDARTDAQRLAAMLRDNLGQADLFPEAAAKASGAAKARAAAAKRVETPQIPKAPLPVAAPAVAAPPPPAVSAPAPVSAPAAQRSVPKASGGNPFDAFR